MLVTTLVVTLLSALPGVVAAPAAVSPGQDTSPANVEKRDAQWDTPWTVEWRVACPPPRLRKWQGNLVNAQWCQDHCGCRTKFVKVNGICRTEKFLECYHNYCECYRQIGHGIP
ncbi:hypothetical protein TWF281_004456 [Arthrobotrys megalospora]